MAFIEVEAVAHYKDTFRLVEICAVTNNTLERTFNLSVVAVISMDFENDSKLNLRVLSVFRPL